MGILDAVALVVFAVAAGGDHGLVGQGDGGVDDGGAEAVGGGLLDAHLPGGAVGLGATADDLAADVDEVAVDALPFEVLRHEVGGIALGDGVEVELGGRVLDDAAAVDGDGGVGCRKHGRQGCAVGFAALLEAEAPGLDDASHAAVESALGVALDVEGVAEEGEEDVVEGVGEVGVDAPQEGAVDPEGRRAVEGEEERVDLRLEVALLRVEVEDAVVGALRLSEELDGLAAAAGGEECRQDGGGDKKASGREMPNACAVR